MFDILDRILPIRILHSLVVIIKNLNLRIFNNFIIIIKSFFFDIFAVITTIKDSPHGMFFRWYSL